MEWFARRHARDGCAAAGRFAPARFYPAQKGLIKWGPDYAPRLSAVYDLFGDGGTALKTSFSKYHRQYDADPFLAYADAGLRQENRNWFDCVLNAAGSACSGAASPFNNDGIAQDHEIGPSPSGGNFGAAFRRASGRPRASVQPGIHRGIQHQVRPRLAVGALFIKRQIRNIQLTDRTFITTHRLHAVSSADAGGDRSGGGGGAQPQRDDHDLQPEPGQEFGLRPGAGRSQQQQRPVVLHGVRGVVLRAAGRQRDALWQLDRGTERLGLLRIRRQPERSDASPTCIRGAMSPNGGRFCDQRQFDMPFMHEFKLAGNYSLPLGIDFGAVIQSYPGLERVITWQPAANLFPNGQRTQAQTIILNEPGSLLSRAMEPGGHQHPEEHPLREQQGAHVPARHLQRVQQQLDSLDDRRGRDARSVR